MNGFIVDCSIAVSWCFKDEATPVTEALLKRLPDEPAFVPAIWHLELGNILVRDERRKRITAYQFAECLKFISTLPLHTDEETTSHAWNEIISLAHAEKLTTYDAAYLELAMRKGLPLATKDKDLIDAARRSGIAVLPK